MFVIALSVLCMVLILLIIFGDELFGDCSLVRPIAALALSLVVFWGVAGTLIAVLLSKLV